MEIGFHDDLVMMIGFPDSTWAFPGIVEPQNLRISDSHALASNGSKLMFSLYERERKIVEKERTSSNRTNSLKKLEFQFFSAFIIDLFAFLQYIEQHDISKALNNRCSKHCSRWITVCLSKASKHTCSFSSHNAEWSLLCISFGTVDWGMLYPSDLSRAEEESSLNPDSFERIAYNLMMLNTGSTTEVHLLVVSVLD